MPAVFPPKSSANARSRELTGSERNRGGADDADLIAQRRALDPHAAPRGRYRLLLHPRARRAEQLLAGAGDAAAEDDELRLEHVHDRREPARERLDRLVPHRGRAGVAGTRGGGDLLGRLEPEPGPARAPRDRRARGVRLEAPTAAAAAAKATAPVDGDVAELAPVPLRAAEEPTADHDPAADAGREREVDHLRGSRSRPPAVLAGGGRRRVVFEGRRAAERAPRELRDGDVAPPGEVQRSDEDAPLGVERAAAADPDRADLRPRDARLGDRAAAHLEESVERGRGAFLRPARLDDERPDAPGGVDDAGRELRPADVEPEDRPVVARGALPLAALGRDALDEVPLEEREQEHHRQDHQQCPGHDHLVVADTAAA